MRCRRNREAREHGPLAACEHDNREREAELWLEEQQAEREPGDNATVVLERPPRQEERQQRNDGVLAVDDEIPERREGGRGKGDEPAIRKIG